MRAAYPTAITGRAMVVFTMAMAMFLGVAAMQWLTGIVASVAIAHGTDPFTAVLASIAALLATGALAFTLLPGPASGLNRRATGLVDACTDFVLNANGFTLPFYRSSISLAMSSQLF